jgi:hypothetical protein
MSCDIRSVFGPTWGRFGSVIVDLRENPCCGGVADRARERVELPRTPPQQLMAVTQASTHKKRLSKALVPPLQRTQQNSQAFADTDTLLIAATSSEMHIIAPTPSPNPGPSATPILLNRDGERFFPLGEDRRATVKRYNSAFLCSVLARVL